MGKILQHIVLGDGNALLLVCQHQQRIPRLDVKQVPDALWDHDLALLPYTNDPRMFSF